MRRATWLGLGVAALLLTACGGGERAASGGAASKATAELPAGARQLQGPVAQAVPAGPAPAPGSKNADLSIQPQPFPVPPPTTGEGPKVIRSAQLTIGVGQGSFDEGLTSVQNLIRGQGGYISGSTAQTAPDDRLRTGTFTFQVPAVRFDDTLDQLRRLGRVQSFSVSGNDVSLQYVDLAARLKNAEAQAAAIQALLGKANTVQEIISVQNQLGQITAQVEQLKGQINYFDHATGYSTISVTLRESGAAAKPAGDGYGTRTALADAAHNFVAGVNVMIVALGTAGPFLILAALGLGGLWWLARRREARAAA